MARGFANAGGHVNVNTETQKKLMTTITKDNQPLLKRSKFQVEVKEAKIKEILKNTTLCIDETVFDDIKNKADRANDSVNSIVNQFIHQFFDKDKNKFTIDIENDTSTKNVSVKISETALTVLKHEAKERNMKIGEYFSKLYLKAIEN